MEDEIKITEVALRDGLQNEKKFIDTESKFQFLKLLEEAGLKNIEITSFVRKDKIPALSDAEEFSKKLNFNSNFYSALIPNLKGLEKAIELGYKEIAIFGAASETFSKKNINTSIQESIEKFKEVTNSAKQNSIKIRAYISTIIHCPYEGKIDSEKVIDLIEEFLSQGVYEISLGETIGLATTNEVEELLSKILKKFPANLFAGHFHDTYSFALGNVAKSIEMGLRSFDSSAGGLGGCPYANGASGNLATEDLVFFLERSGYKTSVDLEKLILASKFIEEKLGRILISKTYLAKK